MILWCAAFEVRSVRRADTKRQLFMQRVEENSSLPEEKS